MAFACAISSVSTAHAQTLNANSGHTLVVKPDGSAWAWGTNGNGELGDNSTTRRDVPTPVSGLTSGVIAIAAGLNHSLALKADGTVWAWGYNGNGQLGLGDTTRRLVPVQISTLSDVVAITAGGNHSLALKSDGTVYGWGANNVGQVGDNTTTQRTSPVQLTTLSGVSAISSRSNHSLALKSDGSIRAWGANGNGQLGDSSTTQRNAPVAVSSLTSVIAISAGTSHSLALKSDNTAWAWGANSNGQLGDSTNTQRTSPVAVTNLGTVTALAGGGTHSVALKFDGSVWSWGQNTNGQLGDGSTTTSWTPVAVANVSDATLIASGESHTLAIESDGTVWATGYNNTAQIGDGTRVTRKSPVELSDPSYVWKVGTPTFSIAAGTYTASQNVVVSTVTTGATIRYTTNGATPTTTDPVVPGNGIVTVSESLTLKVKAWKTGVPDSNADESEYTLRVPTPTLSPGQNTYSAPQNVTVSVAGTGFTLRYTTNGQEPTTTDTIVASGSTVSVAESLTLKVRGWRDNWTVSDVASAIYTMKVAQPSLTPAAGNYTSAQTVTIATTSPGVTLRYTTNGGEPTTSDATIASGNSISVGTASTIRVKGFREGWTDSDTRIGTYTFTMGTVATPTFSPSAGTYTSGQTLTISTTTTDATIRYTTDGSEPTLVSKIYAGPLSIDKPVTLKARGFKRDWTASATTTSAYTFDFGTVAVPTLSPAPGDYPTSRLVTVTTATAGATIHYTTNGVEPTDTDPTVASGATVLIDRSMRLRVKAFKTGMDASAALTGDYWITGTVVAGDAFGVALKSDGTVWTWGANGQGQLGNGTQTQQNSPAQISGLTDVVAIAAGTTHTLAAKRDGTVWAWGSNSSGQLAESTSVQRRLTPTQITALSDVVAVEAGESHSLALKRDGTVCAWGGNSFGQIGNGNNTQQTAPVCLSLTGFTAIRAGSQHSVALKTDGESTGTVWTWGNNATRQLGDGTNVARNTPATVLSGVTSIGAAYEHTLARRADGVAMSWGRNVDGELGDGTQIDRSRPTEMADLDAVTFVGGARRFSLVLTGSGSLWTSGASLGSTLITPYRIPAVGTTVLTADGGVSFALAARRDGTVWTWGPNTSGQLGDGTTTDRWVPRPVPDFSLVDNEWLMTDVDHDGLPTWRELELGTEPLNADTNGDGLRDGAAINAGMSATNLDMDDDGWSNTLERQKGTNPFVADTDGDTVSDGTDFFPLDSTRSQGPQPVPGDTTPPVIVLIFPINVWR